MLRWFSGIGLMFWVITTTSQTIKTNLLAPVSMYYEKKVNPTETIQLGVSFVPDILSLNNYSDLSIIAEYRHYPKVKRLYPLDVHRFYPSGPYYAPYIKFSKLSGYQANRVYALYLGMTAGRKYISPIGKRKWVFETFGGVGIGTPILTFGHSTFRMEAFDFRFGVCIGKHERPAKKKKIE